MDKLHCPECHSSKVTTVGNNLLCLSCGHQDYLYDYRNAFDEGHIEPNAELDTIKEKVNDLESITAEPGQIPRQYDYKLKQLQGEVVYLRDKVNDITTKRRTKGQY